MIYATVGTQEGLLHDLVSVVLVAQHAKSQSEDSGTVPLHDQPESLTVPRAHGCNGRCILSFHPFL
jgi:hypothetical protein